MSGVILSDAEVDAIEVLADALPQPGTRCPTCHRRVNRKKQIDSPPVKEVRFRGPTDVVEAVEEGFDLLQEFAGIDPYGFPRIRLLEALLQLGAQQREELRRHFKGTE